MPSIDFTQVQGLEPIPPGWYDAEIVSAKEGISQADNPKIDLTWKVIGGVADGRNIFDTLAFAPNALWRVKKTLQELGFKKDFRGDVAAEDLVGKSANIYVEIQPSSGTDPATGDPYPERNRVGRLRTIAKTGKKGRDLF